VAPGTRLGNLIAVSPTYEEDRMRRRLIALALLGAAGAPPRAAAQFEGVVTSEVRPKGATAPFTMVQYYKGARVRAEPKLPDAAGAYSIADASANRLVSVTPAKESYLVVELKPLTRLPALVVTGRKETIAGRSCEHVTLTDSGAPGDSTHLCVAKGMGYSGYVGGRGTEGSAGVPDLRAIAGKSALWKQDPAWQALIKGGAFALAATTTREGAVRFQSKVVKVESKKLAADLFSAPADYRGTTMGDLNKMMRSTDAP
jgi:hypothetical protein